tara:strand:+ start:101 stop:1162 length:1062 start_codon:yes stop_codon:yes gene_type:complete
MGYSIDYVDDYKKVLEYVPINKKKIINQEFDKNDILLNRVSNFIIQNNKKKYIISLSGGVDSMVLATILKYLDCELIGIHINYNNRNETIQEQEFLEKWCNYNGIKLYVKNIDHLKRATTNRSEYEKITKKIRFDFYKEIMTKENIDQILLGHHKDDIVENIFANICRGRNILDLAVIRDTCIIEDINIARPMLQFYKTVIYNFALKYDVPYFKDTTPHWSIRGKYRNKISLCIEDAFTSNVKENLIKVSNQCDDWNELIQSNIIEPFMKTIKYTENCVEFNIENYNNYPIAFWSAIFSNIFFKFKKSAPSRKGIQTFMNSINKFSTHNYNISISNLCICSIKKNIVSIVFKV